MTTRKVLITGITGFVGPYLARKLIDEGHEVHGLIQRRADGQRPSRLEQMDLISEVRMVPGDVTDLTSILSALTISEPDWVFHLAAQSYIPESFRDPIGTYRINCQGTQNILEAVRLRHFDTRVIFAGSSEEYGLQFKDSAHYETLKKKYGEITPAPSIFPELPIDEQGSLRPMSPYAVSKVYGDLAFRNYHNSFGLDTVVSRAFNHEGAGRGHNFVTSTIVRQMVSMHLNESNIMHIGDVHSFRDWSHVQDIVNGYMLLADRAQPGAVYVQGSMKSYSVLSYILKTVKELGYEVRETSTLKGEKKIRDPLAKTTVHIGKISYESSVLDSKLLAGDLEYTLKDQGLIVTTQKRKFKITFDSQRFRPSDVPILLSNTAKIKKLGFKIEKDVDDIISDQINYYLDPSKRHNLIA